MKPLHRRLIVAELVLVVIPATAFLAFALLLLVPYSFEMGAYSIKFWLLWLGGVVGGYSLWSMYLRLGEAPITSGAKTVIAIAGIFGLAANLTPLVYVGALEKSPQWLPLMLFSLPSFVWVHWAYTLHRAGSARYG